MTAKENIKKTKLYALIKRAYINVSESVDGIIAKYVVDEMELGISREKAMEKLLHKYQEIVSNDDAPEMQIIRCKKMFWESKWKVLLIPLG